MQFHFLTIPFISIGSFVRVVWFEFATSKTLILSPYQPANWHRKIHTKPHDENTFTWRHYFCARFFRIRYAFFLFVVVLLLVLMHCAPSTSAMAFCSFVTQCCALHFGVFCSFDTMLFCMFRLFFLLASVLPCSISLSLQCANPGYGKVMAFVDFS